METIIFYFITYAFYLIAFMVLIGIRSDIFNLLIHVRSIDKELEKEKKEK